jgi:hypothetical protein
LIDGQESEHSSIYLIDGVGTRALSNMLGSIGSPVTLMHNTLHWNI